MKKFTGNFRQRLSLGITVLLFVAIGSYIWASGHAAGNATLSLSPSSSSISLGSNFTVTVVENSGSETVNAVEADLTYDQTKLQFVSIDTSTSPFSLVASSNGGNGAVQVADGTTTPVSGQQTVATVTFTAIGLGSSAINFSNSSMIADATSNTNALGTATGGTYTVADTTAPSVPTGLNSGSKTDTSVSLSWSASTDNVGVTGYKIYRGGTQIGTSATANYTNTGLSPSTNYSYAVAAYDAAGNTSSKTSALSVTTLPDTTPPSVPTGIALTSNTVTSIKFSWTASTDDVGVTGYKIYRGGTQIGTSATASYTDGGLTPGTSYSYSVAAYDAAGNTSSQSASKSLSTLADTTAPSVPSGLVSTGQTSTSISLSWAASTDNVGVTGYKIYRNGTQVGASTTTSYTDSDLTAGNSYSYSVAAYDAAGNTSAQSSAIQISTVVVPGDANGDGHVDILDFSILASTYGSTTDLRADFNHDGVVNLLDFSILASNWGK